MGSPFLVEALVLLKFVLVLLIFLKCALGLGYLVFF